MILFLVGMPGCGKSHFGRMLAQHLKYTFIDLDTCIEDAFGTTIFEFITAEGEAAFRLVERDVLRKEIANSDRNMVVATGGGCPCYEHNLEFMKQNGVVIWLKESHDTLVQRLMADARQRPLLSFQNEDELRKLILKLERQRLHYYGQSHVIIDAVGLQGFHLFTKRLELFTGQGLERF